MVTVVWHFPTKEDHLMAMGEAEHLLREVVGTEGMALRHIDACDACDLDSSRYCGLARVLMERQVHATLRAREWIRERDEVAASRLAELLDV